MPDAIGEVWKLADSDLPGPAKLDLVRDFDRVLGLDLARLTEPLPPLPAHVRGLLEQRREPRDRGHYPQADALRESVRDSGYEVRDTAGATVALPRDPAFAPDKLVGTFSTSNEVTSFIEEPDTCEFSLNILAHDYQDDVRRCVESALAWCGGRDVEVVVVDNFSGDGLGPWVDELARADARVRVIHTDHRVGEGAGRNMGLKQSRGRYVMVLDTSVEFAGDAFTPLAALLADHRIGAAGAWGVHSHDLRHFDEGTHGPEVDAVEAYCLCFRRSLLRDTGLMDEKYRFYRNLDLDFSIGLRSLGLTNVALEHLPLLKHEHRGWNSVDPDERDKLSRKNFNRFLEKWGNRVDLLAHTAHPGESGVAGQHHHDHDHHDVGHT
ncbi:MAG: glycosyltransferase [Chloroflexota bacterium]